MAGGPRPRIHATRDGRGYLRETETKCYIAMESIKSTMLSAEKNADHTRSHVSSCVDVALTLSAPLPSWMHLNKPLPIHTRSYRNSTTCKYRSGIICSSSRRRTARTCKPTSAAAQRQTAGSTSTAYVPNVMTLSCILIII